MEERKVYWKGDVPKNCQLNGREITDEFVDGRVKGISSWAIMHPDSHERGGCGLGVGCGQRYKKQPDGRWLKVEG